MSFETVVIGDAVLPGLSKYLVQESGEIVSTWGIEPRILKGGTDKDGYRKFVLIDDDGVRRYLRRATMVCEAFHGPRPKGMTVRHRDGTRTNDAKTNLSWATHSVNCMDKSEHGTAQRGTQNGNSKISKETALRIKAMLDKSTREIVREMNVTRGIVDGIRYGKTWLWLLPERAKQVQEVLV